MENDSTGRRGEMVEAFRDHGYWDDEKRGVRVIPGLNAGNVFFSDIVEIPLHQSRSFRLPNPIRALKELLRKGTVK